MKSNLMKLTVLITLAVTILACEDEKFNPENTDQAEANDAKEVVMLKNQLDNSTFNLLATGLRGSTSGRRSGEHRFSKFLKSKSNAARQNEDWETCANFAIIGNQDGTFTVVLDFGEDGCVEDGNLIKGVVAFTGSETENSGEFKVAFENFSETPVDQEIENPFSINGFYEGSYSKDSIPNDSIYESYMDRYTEIFSESFEINYDDGFQEKFVAEGEVASNDNGFVVHKQNFHGSNSDGDTFTGVVVNPLVFDYSCEGVYIYTEGTEAYEFNGEGAIVDYGEGECDNVVTIGQEGITVIIDLDQAG